MKAGELKHRLTFRKVTRATNSMGESVETYVDHCTVWGSVHPLTGRRYFEAQQVDAEVSGEIRIRYRSDILATMQILFGTKTLEIVSLVNTLEANRELVIYYKEKLD